MQPDSLQKTGFSIVDREYGIYVEEYFEEVLCRERKRSERSGKPFALMMLELKAPFQPVDPVHVNKKIAEVLSKTTRETDTSGWSRQGSVIGVILTDLGEDNVEVALGNIENKVRKSLQDHLISLPAESVKISFLVFPERYDKLQSQSEAPFNLLLYPDLLQSDITNRTKGLLKRLMDIAGSLFGLVIFSPLFLTIPLAIKLTSKGPVFFKQERFGRYGKRFIFLKFRSMYLNNDDAIHREYVKKLIVEMSERHSDERGQKEQVVYKIQDDPRVTPLGKFLRKTSLDELPQFINVLKGEMSLVGPRPPIPYELENYSIWHRRRLLGNRPGITGLWQVTGRSSTTFDAMVRLDLRYMKNWSLWLDIKLLLQTPMAVLKGKGAY